MRPADVSKELVDVYWQGHNDPATRNYPKARIAAIVNETGLELKLRNTEHELALIMDKHMPCKWCCDFARKTNGWNHDSPCKNFVVCY